MSGPRPGQVVVVVGTGTDVGKTWVSAALLAGTLAAGMTVAARKPAQSFEPGGGLTDAEVLGAVTGEDPLAVCPGHRWYAVALAPPMAAEALGLPPIAQRDLLDEIVWPEPRVDLGLVEMAGGVASPIADDGHPVDFVHALEPDQVILVADPALGVISAVRTSLVSLAVGEPTRTTVDEGQVVVVLNRYDPEDRVHELNAKWLRTRDRTEIVVTPGNDERSCALDLITRIWPERLSGS
jgi:dethiobiotin synthetase